MSKPYHKIPHADAGPPHLPLIQAPEKEVTLQSKTYQCRIPLGLRPSAAPLPALLQRVGGQRARVVLPFGVLVTLPNSLSLSLAHVCLQMV